MVSLLGFVGVGGVAFGLKDLVEDGESLQTQQTQLGSALRDTGQAAEGAQAKLERMAESLSTRGGFTTTENLAALTQFVSETHSAAKAQQMLTLATNIARRTNTDLETSVQAVSGAYEGRTRGLQKLLGPLEKSTAASIGLTVAHQREIAAIQETAAVMRGPEKTAYEENAEIADHLTSKQIALANVENQLASGHIALTAAMEEMAGSTAVFNRTTAGGVNDLRHSFQNLSEHLGTALLPMMNKLIGAAATVAKWMSRNTGIVAGLIGVFTALGSAMLLSKGIKAIGGLKNDVVQLGIKFKLLEVTGG